jgi:hypothetical protein
MPIVEEHHYTVADGRKWISLHNWIRTLPVDQRNNFYSAEKRQFEYRTQKIQEGQLTVNRNTVGETRGSDYVWQDSEAAEKNKPYDPIWLEFFDRYLSENGITLNIIKREI